MCFGGNQRQSEEIVGSVECMLAWTDGYTISNSGLVGRSLSNGVVDELSTFESISSAEICVKIH